MPGAEFKPVGFAFPTRGGSMKMNKVVLVTLLFAMNLVASSQVVSSDITTDATWDADTVFIDKPDFTVQSGARLTIVPGTAVKVMKTLRFITVRGAITARGTVTDSINFSQENVQIKWQGIRFLKREQETGKLDSSFFGYCNLIGAYCAEVDSLWMKKGGTLYCGEGNYIELDNSFISKNEGYQGGAMYVDSGSTARIANCLFSRNTAGALGGGAIKTCDNGSANLMVENCRFEYNWARTGGAVRIGKGTTAVFDNCVFYRDTTLSINPGLGDLNGGAFAVSGPADVTLRNCMIFFCRSYGKGGGIHSADASLKLINCTVVANQSIYGGGIYLARESAASSPIFVNTLIGANGEIAGVTLPRDSAGCGIFLDSSVTPAFSYCDMYDTVYDYTIKPYGGEFANSKYYKTYFVKSMPGVDAGDTVVEGYQLYRRFDKKDPAVDGGTPDTTGLGLPEFDLLGQKRIYGTAVDIGAIEFNDTLLTMVPFSHVGKPPRFDGDPCEMIIYSLSGRKIRAFTGKASLQNISMVVGARVPKGIYLVSMNRSGRQLWIKTVFVK